MERKVEFVKHYLPFPLQKSQPELKKHEETAVPLQMSLKSLLDNLSCELTECLNHCNTITTLFGIQRCVIVKSVHVFISVVHLTVLFVLLWNQTGQWPFSFEKS